MRDFPDMDVGSSPGSNLELLIANEMLLMKEQVLNELAPVAFNELGLVRRMAATINDSPSRYDETQALILERMQRLGIPEGKLVIPAPAAHAPAPEDGVHVLGPYEVMFVVDGNSVGLHTIADAVGLSAQLVPGLEAMVRVTQTVPRGALPVVSIEPLGLTKNSDGAGALVSGWGEPEPWGTWSVDRACVIRIHVPAGSEGALRLGLRYRAIPFPDGTPRIVLCMLGDETLHEWQLTSSSAEGELAIEIPRELVSSAIELTLVNVNARSPVELGVGPDERRLGIGVEQLRLLP